MIWRIGWIYDILQNHSIFKIVQYTTASAARNWINSASQTAATTFAFPSVLSFFYGIHYLKRQIQEKVYFSLSTKHQTGFIFLIYPSLNCYNFYFLCLQWYQLLADRTVKMREYLMHNDILFSTFSLQSHWKSWSADIR